MVSIVFRVDSGFKIGSGHIMRCINLANYLSKHCKHIYFICVNHDGNMSKLTSPYIVKIIEREEDSWLGNKWIIDVEKTINIVKNITNVFLIIDQYKIDYEWEIKIRPYVNKIMVIDDLGNRKHDCDILLDQNLYIDNNPYLNLVSDKCKMLVGCKYVILNNNFIIKQKKNKVESKIESKVESKVESKIESKVESKVERKINRICIFFGGSDNNNFTETVLKNIKEKFNNIIFDIIIGHANENRKSLLKYSKYSNFIFYFSLKPVDMANIVNQSDLCIGSSGTSSYERCALGLFTLVITVATNQLSNAYNLQQMGVIDYVGNYDDKEIINNLINKLKYYISSDINWKNICEKCYKLIDGKGLERIKNEIFT